MSPEEDRKGATSETSPVANDLDESSISQICSRHHICYHYVPELIHWHSQANYTLDISKKPSAK